MLKMPVIGHRFLIAAEERHEGVVRLLLDRGDVDANAKDEDGWTTLFYAVVGGFEALVKLLAERDGVEIDSEDNFGRTAMSYVMKGEGRSKAIFNLLKLGI